MHRGPQIRLPALHLTAQKHITPLCINCVDVTHCHDVQININSTPGTMKDTNGVTHSPSKEFIVDAEPACTATHGALSVCICECVYARVYIYIYIYICVCVCVCVCPYVRCCILYLWVCVSVDLGSDVCECIKHRIIWQTIY